MSKHNKCKLLERKSKSFIARLILFLSLYITASAALAANALIGMRFDVRCTKMAVKEKQFYIAEAQVFNWSKKQIEIKDANLFQYNNYGQIGDLFAIETPIFHNVITENNRVNVPAASVGQLSWKLAFKKLPENKLAYRTLSKNWYSSALQIKLRFRSEKAERVLCSRKQIAYVFTPSKLVQTTQQALHSLSPVYRGEIFHLNPQRFVIASSIYQAARVEAPTLLKLMRCWGLQMSWRTLEAKFAYRDFLSKGNLSNHNKKINKWIAQLDLATRYAKSENPGWLKEKAQSAMEIGKPFTNSLGMKMLWVPPGKYHMGARKEDYIDYKNAALPRHEVKFQKGFWMSETEVTQEHWTAVMGGNRLDCLYEKPSIRFTWFGSGKNEDDYIFREKWGERGMTNSIFLAKGKKRPATCSWLDSQFFCARLSYSEGKNYCLPSEAEWEYACRAGSAETRYGKIEEIAWYQQNSPYASKDVALKLPNSWGFHDMIGNVMEYCYDTWHPNYKDAPMDGSARICLSEKDLSLSFSGDSPRRGGDYTCDPGLCNAISRVSFHDTKESELSTGFRVVVHPK